jgi:hypothetical protein
MREQETKPVTAAASALAKMRWAGKTKKQRSEHARMMAEKRWAERDRRRAEAEAEGVQK